MDAVGGEPVGCCGAVLGKGFVYGVWGKREQVWSLPYVDGCGVAD